MVFKKIKGTLATYQHVPKLALYNATLEDIVLIDDSFFKVVKEGFEEIDFIFHLENSQTYGI